jgi:hypothetical protein
MSFQNKYLKYKQKYLNLKSQSGGSNNAPQELLVRTYLSDNAPPGIFPGTFVNMNYRKGMTISEARRIIDIHPDIVRAYLSNNTPQGTNPVTFVNMNYREGMTISEARRIIQIHPDIIRPKIIEYLLHHLPANIINNQRELDANEHANAIIYGDVTVEEAIDRLRNYMHRNGIEIQDHDIFQGLYRR